MQLTCIIYISEDNYKIERDRFETDSVNVIKDRPLIVKKHRKFKYILTWFSLSEKPWTLSLGTTTLKMFVSHTGLWELLEKFDDLEKYWANATGNL